MFTYHWMVGLFLKDGLQGMRKETVMTSLKLLETWGKTSETKPVVLHNQYPRRRPAVTTNVTEYILLCMPGRILQILCEGKLWYWLFIQRKLHPTRAMKAQGRCRSTAPLLPTPLCHMVVGGKRHPRLGTHFTRSLGVGLDGYGKSPPNRVRFPDHSARSKSIYRLSHSGRRQLFMKLTG